MPDNLRMMISFPDLNKNQQISNGWQISISQRKTPLYYRLLSYILQLQVFKARNHVKHSKMRKKRRKSQINNRINIDSIINH